MAYFHFILTVLLFSSMEVASKPLMSFLDPFQFTFHRFAMGFLLLVIVFVIRGENRTLLALRSRDFILLAALGILNTFIAMSLLQLAVRAGNAATAATIVSANPLFVYLLALFGRIESFSLRRVIGIVTGIGGIVLTMFDRGFSLDTGAFYALLAALLFSLYTILNAPVARRVGTLTANVFSFFSGLLAMILFLSFTGIGLLPPRHIIETASSFAAFLYLGVAVTGIGYLTFLSTVVRLGPLAASVMFLLKPAIATLLALLFLGEHLPPLFWPGLILVTVGSGLILKKGQTAPRG